MELRAITQKGTYWVETADTLYHVRLKLKELREKEEILLDSLKEMSNYKNAFGGPFIFTASMRKGAVDYELVPELQGVDLERYRKEQVANWKLQRVSI